MDLSILTWRSSLSSHYHLPYHLSQPQPQHPLPQESPLCHLQLVDYHCSSNRTLLWVYFSVPLSQHWMCRSAPFVCQPEEQVIGIGAGNEYRQALVWRSMLIVSRNVSLIGCACLHGNKLLKQRITTSYYKLGALEAKLFARMCCYLKRYPQKWVRFLVHKEDAGSLDSKIGVLHLGLYT